VSSGNRGDTSDYLPLFLNDTPLLDARAPVEFARGAFPAASNHPLLTDQERERIGLCYKQHGQDAAIALGHQLVSGNTRDKRIESWAAFARQHPEGYLYCFRGGLRSAIVHQWLAEAGVRYPRVTGGYKAMRRFLIESLDDIMRSHPLIVVAGFTGCGKTEVIAQLESALDLEHCANHRGSSFGRHVSAQPTQINFENCVAINALKLQHTPCPAIVVEEEGRLIGRCFVPLSVQQAIKQAPVVVLEDREEARVDRILESYVINMLSEFSTVYPQNPEHAFAVFSDYLLSGLDRIRKRLGGDRFAALRTSMSNALQEQQRNGDYSAHRIWISGLLHDYYDPVYRYQREGSSQKILFSGNQAEVLDFLRSQPGMCS
jgi:tRNA 2-selenouridine synthase